MQQANYRRSIHVVLAWKRLAAGPAATERDRDRRGSGLQTQTPRCGRQNAADSIFALTGDVTARHRCNSVFPRNVSSLSHHQHHHRSRTVCQRSAVELSEDRQSELVHGATVTRSPFPRPAPQTVAVPKVSWQPRA